MDTALTQPPIHIGGVEVPAGGRVAPQPGK